MAASKKSSTKTGQSTSGNTSLKFLSSAHPVVRDHLSATTDLPTFLSSAGVLSLDERRLLVDQALLLLEENYVHLPLKESMHGVDPVQRLRLVQHRLDQTTPATMGSEFEFHREMLDIFNSIRDLHTNYLLPRPFSRMEAFLPFDIEEYFEDGKPRYIATHFVPGFSHRHFKAGVEIKTWNGVPIERAIEVNADRHAGSNAAARHVRGLDGLTARPLRMALPPDELWVIIGYVDDDGKEREMRQDWLVSPELPDSDGVDANAVSLTATSLGVDLEASLISQMRKVLFAPKVLEEEQRGVGEVTTGIAAAGQSVPSRMPGVFSAKSASTVHGAFGYIRIFTFSVNDPEAFVEEFIRLVEQMPKDGLIIDVRGNGGGHIWASEGLLQVLTPTKIAPEPVQFINSALNLRICERHENNPAGIDLGPWVASMRESVTTGAIYTRSFPITPVEFANRWGQHYHGPIVLITDARCYSATDIFAAGFKDHGIGHVIGVDDNTGAGGANVWTHSLLRDLLRFPTPVDPESPYKVLPNGANMRVSIRRTLRVGAHSGTAVEDLGIRPHERYFMSKNDLLNSNQDLIERAAKVLSSKPVRQLDVSLDQTAPRLEFSIDTKGLDRIDVYVDARPLESVNISDGTTDMAVNTAPDAKLLELVGFEGGIRVAARKIEI